MSLVSLDSRIGALLAEAIGTTCTAAVCLVRGDNGGVCRIAAGNTDPDADGAQVTADTPFDLASLTKVFTGAAALRLAARRLLDPDASVQRYLPDFHGEAKEGVRVWHLLTHTSGLPAGPGLYGRRAGVDPRGALLRIPLSNPPGAKVVYSDTGFLVLGRVIEAVTGERLDAAIRELVCNPLGIRSTTFGPRPGAAATEWNVSRNRRARGEVHDENAAELGGVAGHAGLFGPAGDVLTLASAFADPASRFLPTDMITAATSEQVVDGSERRGLAWKLRSPLADAPERAFSAGSFGHYGFTGTAVWHDPHRGATAVLLTNRVYYGRDPEPVRRLRTDLFDVVAGVIPGRDRGEAPP